MHFEIGMKRIWFTAVLLGIAAAGVGPRRSTSDAGGAYVCRKWEEVFAGWEAVSDHLGRDALSAGSAGVLASAVEDGEGDGAECDYDLCVLECA